MSDLESIKRAHFVRNSKEGCIYISGYSSTFKIFINQSPLTKTPTRSALPRLTVRKGIVASSRCSQLFRNKLKDLLLFFSFK
jgi:hypothetical protein